MEIDIILKYFPDLSERQKEQFTQLGILYPEWNEKINVISRKDMDALYERHILHSLAIAKVMAFANGSNILDIGTGGGFPGIPLAILFPEVKFHLVDSIGKKITVVKDIAEQLKLTNVKASNQRAEQIKDKFDFIVSRAVTNMPRFLTWTQSLITKKQINPFPNGILALKGGNLDEEFETVKRDYDIIDIPMFFEEDFFETKKVVYVRLV